MRLLSVHWDRISDVTIPFNFITMKTKERRSLAEIGMVRIRMNWDKFTVMSQEAFQKSQSKAAQMGHQELKPEHLLWIFLIQEENIVNAVLEKIGIEREKVRARLDEILTQMPKVEGGGEVYLSPAIRQILTSAQ
jgi:ATP-dependent Clp protease ATP-binding subunit ClpB